MAFLLVGCSGGDGGNPDYNTEIVMTPEQKAKMEEDMKNRPAPGTAKPGVPIEPGAPQAEPEKMKMPPGKGGR